MRWTAPDEPRKNVSGITAILVLVINLLINTFTVYLIWNYVFVTVFKFPALDLVQSFLFWYFIFTIIGKGFKASV